MCVCWLVTRLPTGEQVLCRCSPFVCVYATTLAIAETSYPVVSFVPRECRVLYRIYGHVHLHILIRPSLERDGQRQRLFRRRGTIVFFTLCPNLPHQRGLHNSRDAHRAEQLQIDAKIMPRVGCAAGGV